MITIYQVYHCQSIIFIKSASSHFLLVICGRDRNPKLWSLFSIWPAGISSLSPSLSWNSDSWSTIVAFIVRLVIISISQSQVLTLTCITLGYITFGTRNWSIAIELLEIICLFKLSADSWALWMLWYISF